MAAEKLNVYDLRISQPGSDLVTLAAVAAPNIRKALATVVVSEFPEGAVVWWMNLAQRNASTYEFDDTILVWEPSHGIVTSMVGELPSSTHYLGEFVVKPVEEEEQIVTADMLEIVDEEIDTHPEVGGYVMEPVPASLLGDTGSEDIEEESPDDENIEDGDLEEMSEPEEDTYPTPGIAEDLI